jgi:hypothetical protein
MGSGERAYRIGQGSNLAAAEAELARLQAEERTDPASILSEQTQKIDGLLADLTEQRASTVYQQPQPERKQPIRWDVLVIIGIVILVLVYGKNT